MLLSYHCCLNSVIAYLHCCTINRTTNNDNELIHTHVYVCIHVCMYVYIIYICIYVFIVYVCMYIYIYVCIVYVYIYIYICIYVFICVFIRLCMYLFLFMLVCMHAGWQIIAIMILHLASYTSIRRTYTPIHIYMYT